MDDYIIFRQSKKYKRQKNKKLPSQANCCVEEQKSLEITLFFQLVINLSHMGHYTTIAKLVNLSYYIVNLTCLLWLKPWLYRKVF